MSLFVKVSEDGATKYIELRDPRDSFAKKFVSLRPNSLVETAEESEVFEAESRGDEICRLP